ncbi:MAG: type II toxin-antitoxin system Phd/YefM family antitoxin [Planctomycetia bacterium]|jgi:prevent-host-death family protein
MDLTRDIDSLTHFKRNTSTVIEQIKATGQPMVLTVNGKAEVVVQDASSYQQMLDLVERAEAVLGIKKGLESIERGEGIPAEEAFARLRKRGKKSPKGA